MSSDVDDNAFTSGSSGSRLQAALLSTYILTQRFLPITLAINHPVVGAVQCCFFPETWKNPVLEVLNLGAVSFDLSEEVFSFFFVRHSFV